MKIDLDKFNLSMKRSPVLFLCLILIGCTGMPTVRTTSKLSIDSLGTVAVLPFDGYRGDEFSDFISQEMMMRGVSIMERSRVLSLLLEKGIDVSDIKNGQISYEKLSGVVGVKTLAMGSVSPITVYASGGPSGKVSAATLRLVSVNDGRVIGVATYNANTELLAGSVLYPKAAEKLVKAIFGK